MSFAVALASERLPVAVEITPPRVSRPAILRRRAMLLGHAPDAVNVIQRPDRQSSLDASCELKAAGFEAVMHLVARGTTGRMLEATLERAGEAAIGNVLCILGDTKDGPAIKVKDLVAATVRALPGALVGATLNQYGDRPERAVANLLAKLEAGATFVETQPVFDAGALEPFVESARKEVPGTRFVAMLMPITSPDALRRMEARLRIAAPDDYARRIADGPQSAWEAFAEIIDSLRRSRLVDGLAIMTPDMDPPAETVARIAAALLPAGVRSSSRLE
jgi:5,10-methylenetetrahydrofolate reductase